MRIIATHKQRGIGLIEALITTVIVAVGLLAMASLQSELMSQSGESKIRSEALALAKQKLEQLRNNINVAGYNANAAGTVNDPANPIVGTNASFTRTWTITDNTAFIASSPARKRISVKVSWGAGGADEAVNVVTEMAWVNPADSALYAYLNSGAGAGATPSPRQNASEDVAYENVIGTNLAISDQDLSTTGTSGVDAQVGVDPENDGSYIVLNQVAPGSHYYTATNSISSSIQPGVIAVFLCSDADNDASTADTCTHIQNHFGGVVHRHAGTVYSSTGNGLNHIQVAWTSSDVNACFNAPPTTTSVPIGSASPTGTVASMAYECVFAGNCNATPSASRTRTASGTGSTNPGCFVTSEVSDAQINARNVGPGGEFGDVGLLGVKDSTGGGFRREEVCFLEETAASSTPIVNLSGSRLGLNENYLLPVTKRAYVTRRILSDGSKNTQRSEGINRSYTNHNFLVIERKSSNSSSGSCNQIALDDQIVLAPRVINRIYNESATNNNVAAAESAYPGIHGAPAVATGTVSGNATDLRFYIQELGTCYVKSDDTAYACVAPAGTKTTSSTTDAATGITTTVTTEIATSTGATTVTTTVGGTTITSTSTTSPTVTVKGGSKTHPDPATDPQSFSSCSPLPSGTCNWTGNF